MGDELNFDGLSEDLDVFDCPKCGQTIDASADVCRFCGAKVDHKAAQQAAHLLARVDLACSEASYLRSAATIALILVGGVVFALGRQPRFFVLFGFENALLGFCALVILVCSPFPLWTLRWWKKYAGLTSGDDELQDARKFVKGVGTTTTAALLAFGSVLCVEWLLRIAYP